MSDDRMTLAKAMDMARQDIGYFDPFENAADDYAVLEWMRQDKRFSGFRIAAGWKDKTPYMWKYQVGDFARAALKVLG